jgi:hypothetical protein
MSNIDEQLSAYTRRRIPYNEISRIIDGVIDYDITPAWYDDKDEWISEVCNYIVDYINEDRKSTRLNSSHTPSGQ